LYDHWSNHCDIVETLNKLLDSFSTRFSMPFDNRQTRMTHKVLLFDKKQKGYYWKPYWEEQNKL